jgi:hypothetical protein
MICWRLNASSCAVRAARSAAWLIALTLSSKLVEDRGEPDSLGGQILGQEFGVAVDHEEHVVEVVGDPAGQPADRLELLGLEQLALASLRTLMSRIAA